MSFETVKSILYVEDEKSVQNELADFLENFCEKLYVADDGYQGLDSFNKYHQEIVISDIKMPVMDGLEMSKKIREIDIETPIIFTTAFSDIEYFMEAIELQVDGYILKPVSLESLENKINSIIQNIKLKFELYEKEQMLIQTSKLAAMGEMIGNIAHQWKQPLSIISSNANSIKADYALEGKIKTEDSIKFADQTLEQIMYLSDTIDDFRNFFAPNTKNKAFNLKIFMDKCVNLVSSSFDSNMIQTIKEIDDKINTYGDPNQLIQAIVNILNNAKDALKNAQKLQKKLVFIFTLKEDDSNNILISIKDNAGGIPERILPRVFEPYFTTKLDSGGTGLGLYITHTIITNNLKGSIKVENEIFEHEGVSYKGAKFTIKLPLNL